MEHRHLSQGIEQILERYLLIRCEVGYSAKKPMRCVDVAGCCDEAHLTDGRLSPKQVIREFDGTLTDDV